MEKLQRGSSIAVDFAVITALSLERRAVCSALGLADEDRVTRGGRVYWRGRLALPDDKFYEIVVAQPLDLANVDAALVTSAAISEWQPQSLLFVGIAGAATDEIQLGDVIFGRRVYYYERGKVGAAQQLEPVMYPADAQLLNVAMSKEDWKEPILLPRPDGGANRPRIHIGDIASGEKVIAEEKARDEIVSRDRRILAIEMEGYGFSSAVWQSANRERYLILRVACDKADRNKNQDWQPYASAVGAAVLLDFLRDSSVQSQFPPRADLSAGRGDFTPHKEPNIRGDSEGRPNPPTGGRSEAAIVFVPGFFGTELLYRTSSKSWPERVWSADGTTLVTTLALHPKRLECDTELEVGKVIPAIYFGTDYFALYQRLFDMVKQLGYEDERNFFRFGYDWRLSIKTNARRLSDFLERIGDDRPVNVIAHSLGGLIVRYMLADQASLNGHSNIHSVIQIATPVLGCSRAYFALKESAQLGDLCEWMKKHMTRLDKGSFERLKNAMNHFESVMELLPHDNEKILKTQGGKLYPALYPDAWPDVDQARIKSIQELHSVVRKAEQPSIITIYSVDISTDRMYEVDDTFRKITKKFSSQGDGVALGTSAEHGSSAIHPLTIQATHYYLPSRNEVLALVKDNISSANGHAF